VPVIARPRCLPPLRPVCPKALAFFCPPFSSCADAAKSSFDVHGRVKAPGAGARTQAHRVPVLRPVFLDRKDGHGKPPPIGVDVQRSPSLKSLST
jgi:hypothetical protein